METKGFKGQPGLQELEKVEEARKNRGILVLSRLFFFFVSVNSYLLNDSHFLNFLMCSEFQTKTRARITVFLKQQCHKIRKY